MTILAVVGMTGSGKSVFSSHLYENGFSLIYFGEIILKEVNDRGLEVNPDNEKIVREDLRKKYGMGVCALFSISKIKEELKRNKKVCIDGLYSFSEYKLLKSEFGEKLIVVAVFAPKKLRYERVSIRLNRPLTNLEAEHRDYMEIENIEKGGPIAIADYTIINDSSKNSFKIKIDEFLKLFR